MRKKRAREIAQMFEPPDCIAARDHENWRRKFGLFLHWSNGDTATAFWKATGGCLYRHDSFIPTHDATPFLGNLDKFWRANRDLMETKTPVVQSRAAGTLGRCRPRTENHDSQVKQTS